MLDTLRRTPGHSTGPVCHALNVSNFPLYMNLMSAACACFAWLKLSSHDVKRSWNKILFLNIPVEILQLEYSKIIIRQKTVIYETLNKKNVCFGINLK